VVCCGEEHERRDGDVAGHERQRLGCSGGHVGDVDSVSPGVLLRGWRRCWWSLLERGGGGCC
jgi:hypothetical protein